MGLSGHSQNWNLVMPMTSSQYQVLHAKLSASAGRGLLAMPTAEAAAISDEQLRSKYLVDPGEFRTYIALRDGQKSPFEPAHLWERSNARLQARMAGCTPTIKE